MRIVPATAAITKAAAAEISIAAANGGPAGEVK
jgi:hypothetical protein